METYILISVVLTIWTGCTFSYETRPPGIQNPQPIPTIYPYRYNNSNKGWEQPIHYPEDTSTYFTQNLASQSYVDHRYDPNYSDLISNSILELAHKLGTKLEAYGSSQIFSPISIASALALLLLGSKGKTHQELLQLFGLDQNPLYNSKPYKIHEEFGLMIEDLLENSIHPSRTRPQPSWKFTHQNDYFGMQNTQSRSLIDEEHVIRVANGLFIQNKFTLRPDYKTVVEEVYKSEITPLDFAGNTRDAKNYINRWVNDKTRGKIPTIISDEISPDTSVIIANALYFKAFWDKEFLEGATTTSEFYPDGLDGRSIQVKMMANGGVFPFYEAKEYGCRIIGLPYKKNLSTMYIIMPEESSRTKIRDLQAQLTAHKIEDMISRMTRKTAIIAFPKLHITNSLYLKYVLADLGVNTIFTRGLCDLSLIADGPIAKSNYNNYHDRLIFARIGEDEPITNTTNRSKRGITYKVESSIPRTHEPLRLKDFILNKRITKENPGKKRNRRQVIDPSNSIKNLDGIRRLPGVFNPQLFVDEIVHKVDLVVNEKGTEGGAATVAYLRRSGPEVLFRADTPFILLVRHDPTKLPLFYGTVYEPVDSSS